MVKNHVPTANKLPMNQSTLKGPAAFGAPVGPLSVGVVLPRELPFLPLPVEPLLAPVSVGVSVDSIVVTRDAPPVPATSMVLPLVLIVRMCLVPAAVMVSPIVSVILSTMNCIKEFAAKIVMSSVTIIDVLVA
jgi:hypothetical protein